MTRTKDALTLPVYNHELPPWLQNSRILKFNYFILTLYYLEAAHPKFQIILLRLWRLNKIGIRNLGCE